MGKATWTTEQYEKVRDLYSIMTCLQIGQLLGKTEQIIKGAAIRLGLTRTGTDYVRFPDAVRPCELLLVKALYKDTPAYKIVDYLPGRNEVAIIRIAHYHNIRRTAEETRAVSKFNRGMYEKGAVSHNKGKKGWKPGGRSAETQFTKGQTPKNTLSNLEIVRRVDSRGRPFMRIKVDGRGMIYLSHYVWEQCNGPVPKGMLVCHQDYNPENCAIENLVLRTRRENAQAQTGRRSHNDLGNKRTSLAAIERREAQQQARTSDRIAKERLKAEIANLAADRKKAIKEQQVISRLVKAAKRAQPKMAATKAVVAKVKAAERTVAKAKAAVVKEQKKREKEARKQPKPPNVRSKKAKPVADPEIELQKELIRLARKEQARTRERTKARRYLEGDNKKVDTRRGHEIKAAYDRYEVGKKMILFCKPGNEEEFLIKYPNAKKLI